MWVIAFIILVSACKPEFDPNEDFEVIDVMYGGLDSDADTSIIKVFSAFPHDFIDKQGDVISSDAIYYRDSMELELTEYDPSGVLVKQMLLPKVAANNMRQGYFNFDENEYFVVDSSQFRITEDYHYTLRLRNLKTGKVSVASIKCIGDFTILKPFYDKKAINFVRNNEYLNTVIQLQSKTDKEFVTDTYFNTVYTHRKSLQTGGGVLVRDTLVLPIKLGSGHESHQLPTIQLSVISGSAWINLLLQTLDPVTEDEWRRFEEFYIEINTYSKELKNYVEAEQHFNALSQQKPIYTNIYDETTEAPQAGVFYSKKTKIRYISLSDTTQAYFDTSAVVKHLGF